MGKVAQSLFGGDEWVLWFMKGGVIGLFLSVAWMAVSGISDEGEVEVVQAAEIVELRGRVKELEGELVELRTAFQKISERLVGVEHELLRRQVQRSLRLQDNARRRKLKEE